MLEKFQRQQQLSSCCCCEVTTGTRIPFSSRFRCNVFAVYCTMRVSDLVFVTCGVFVISLFPPSSCQQNAQYVLITTYSNSTSCSGNVVSYVYQSTSCNFNVEYTCLPNNITQYNCSALSCSDVCQITQLPNKCVANATLQQSTTFSCANSVNVPQGYAYVYEYWNNNKCQGNPDQTVAYRLNECWAEQGDYLYVTCTSSTVKISKCDDNQCTQGCSTEPVTTGCLSTGSTSQQWNCGTG